MFITFVFLCFITVLIIFVNTEIYLRKVFNEIKQVSDNNQELFSFITYLFFGISVISRGIDSIKVYLYPKYMTIERGNSQRVINDINITFSRFLGNECIEIKVPDMEKPLRFMISDKDKSVMQKYLETVNKYETEEDIIKYFETD